MENQELKKRDVDFNKPENTSSGTNELPFTPGVYYPKRKISSYSRMKSSRNNDRVVFKSGEFNIDETVQNKFRIGNWFVTMVQAKWRFTLLNFFLAYTMDWILFGFFYWVIALFHGDLKEEHLPMNQNTSNWTPCVKNIYGFTSTFLFSIEVHTTVAYGKRTITLECPQAITAMCLQCVLSSIFQAFMVGILFAKLTRPKARTQTILFSKHAVINLKNEKFCLVFRVGDIRKSRILNIKVKVYVIRMNSVEYLDSFEQIELKTEMDGCESTFFLWPLSVIHIIDSDSPLCNVSAVDLLCGKLELLAVFEGTIETTGQPIQARSSYTGNDILWGHRFTSMVEFDDHKNVYEVDYHKLNFTDEVDTPLCSADEYKKLLQRMKFINGVHY